jgi:hypothetical protein
MVLFQWLYTHARRHNHVHRKRYGVCLGLAITLYIYAVYARLSAHVVIGFPSLVRVSCVVPECCALSQGSSASMAVQR